MAHGEYYWNSASAESASAEAWNSRGDRLGIVQVHAGAQVSAEAWNSSSACRGSSECRVLRVLE